MAYEELELRVHLWTQEDPSGILLCYQMIGLTPVGLHKEGSRSFGNRTEIDTALVDARIAPSAVGNSEKTATVSALEFWQLKRLGLEPQKNPA